MEDCLRLVIKFCDRDTLYKLCNVDSMFSAVLTPDVLSEVFNMDCIISTQEEYILNYELLHRINGLSKLITRQKLAACKFKPDYISLAFFKSCIHNRYVGDNVRELQWALKIWPCDKLADKILSIVMIGKVDLSVDTMLELSRKTAPLLIRDMANGIRIESDNIIMSCHNEDRIFSRELIYDVLCGRCIPIVLEGTQLLERYKQLLL